MQFHLTHSGVDISKICFDSFVMGRGVPPQFEDPPTALEGQDFFLKIWYELNSCRQLGMGAPGSIPWTAINDWCHINRIDDDQREDVFYMVRALDNAYLQHVSAKIT